MNCEEFTIRWCKPDFKLYVAKASIQLNKTGFLAFLFATPSHPP